MLLLLLLFLSLLFLLSGEMKNGDVRLLENVRFYTDEEQNDPLFARQLASCADIYVNDAFGTAHRAHASTEVSVCMK